MGKSINTISSETFRKTIRNKRPINEVALELTSTCNLRCIHCYLGHQTNVSSLKKRELSLKEIKRILDGLVDHGCMFLLFTGGEPFTRKDFFEIYEYAYKKDFVISLFTNATLINGKAVSFLKDHPPQYIEPTVYGMTEKTYEGITQVPGSYKRFWNGVNLLLDQSLPVGLKFILLQKNKHELFDFKNFCENKNLKYKSDPRISPRINLDKIPLNFSLTPEEAAELSFVYADKQEWGKRKRKDIYCGAGETNAFISSTGQLCSCILLREYDTGPHTDLRKTSLDDAWNKLKNRPMYPVEKKCRTCHSFKYCFQCPARAYLTRGSYKKVDEFSCGFAQTLDKCIPKKIP
jgi:radical SAM protein with 4Fe4S-binding SPASM domain